MNNSNLPPGMSMKDVPGNTIDDEIFERISEGISNAMDYSIPEENFLSLVDYVYTLISDAWDRGYKVGKADQP